MKKTCAIAMMVLISGLMIQSCENVQSPNAPATQSPVETISAENTTLYNTELGDEGCTPGYWKNHLDAWPIGLHKTVGDAFSEASIQFPDLADDLLLDALSYQGGSGLDGAARILLRAAAAAALNAKEHGVAYSCPISEVVSDVNGALASDDRAYMLEIARKLDDYNNGVGGCPLN